MRFMTTDARTANSFKQKGYKVIHISLGLWLICSHDEKIEEEKYLPKKKKKRPKHPTVNTSKEQLHNDLQQYKGKKKIDIIKDMYSCGRAVNEIVQVLYFLFETPKEKLQRYVLTLTYKLSRNLKGEQRYDNKQ